MVHGSPTYILLSGMQDNMLIQAFCSQVSIASDIPPTTTVVAL